MSGLSRSMRPRNSCVSSTLEVLRPASIIASCFRLLLIMWRELLYDFGNEVESVGHGRLGRAVAENGRIGLERCTLVGGGDDIGAQTLGNVLGMRHWRDAGGVDRLHFLDQVEDAGQLGERGLNVILADLDAGEVGNALDIFGSQ